MPLSYRQVLEQYDRAKAFYGEDRPLPEYASAVNAAFDTQDFSEGMRDGPWTRFSTRADQALEASPLGELGGVALGGVSAATGHTFDQGYDLGSKLPRMFANTAPMLIPVPFVNAALTGLAFGAHTQAETGDPMSSLISGVTGAILPGVGKLGGNLGARAVGGEVLGKEAAQYLPELAGTAMAPTAATTGRVAAGRFVGSQAAQLGTMQASSAVQAAHAGTPYDPFDPNFIIQQIPFTALDIVHAAHSSPELNVRKQTWNAKKIAEAQPKPPTGPQRTAPTAAEEQNTAAAVENFGRVLADANGDPAKLDAAFQALNLTVQNPEMVNGVKSQVQESLTPRPEGEPDLSVPTATAGGFKVVDESGNTVASGLTAEDAELHRQALGDEDPMTNFRVEQEPQTVEPVASVEATPPVEPVGLQPQDLETLGKMGVEEPTVAAPLVEGQESQPLITVPHPVEIQPALKQAAGDFVQAQANEAKARTTTSLVPETGAEVMQVVPATEAPHIAGEVAEGATPKQAVTSAQLKTATTEVDSATTNQKLAIDWSKNLVGEARKQAAALGGELLSKLEILARAPTAEGETNFGQRVLIAITKTLSNPNIQREKVTEDIQVVLAKWQQRQGTEAELLRSLSAVGKTATKRASRGFKKHPDSEVYQTREEAQKFLDELPTQEREEGYEIRTHDREGKQRGKFQTFTIAKRLFPAEQDVSLNAKVGDEGEAEFGDSITENPIAPYEPVEPTVMADEVKNTKSAIARKVAESPDGFAAAAGLHPEDATVFLQQYAEVMEFGASGVKGDPLTVINESLRSQGIEPFADRQQMAERVQKVDYYLQDYKPNIQAYDLDSTFATYTPEELAMHQQIGRDIPSMLAWVAKQKNPLWAEFAKSYLQFGTELKAVRAILPGDADHNGTAGWYFHSPFGDEGQIQVAWLPHAHELEHFAQQVLHETTHALSRTLEKGTDARSVEFRVKLDEVLDALRKSEQLPAKVRSLISRAVKEGHYEKYVRGEWSWKDLQEDWEKAVGTADYKEWKNVIYGLLNHDELLAGTFSDGKMVKLGLSTEMPTQGLSVWRWFSQWWNKIFNGPVENGTAFERIVSGFDQYLSAGNLRKTYNGFDYIRESLLDSGIRPEALSSRVKTIDLMFGRGTLEASLVGYNREGQAGVLPATNAVWKDVIPDRSVLTSPVAMRTHVVSALAEDVPVLQDLWNQMRQDLKITENLVKQVKDGTILGQLPENTEANLKKSRAVLNAFKEGLNRQARALQTLNDIQNLTPDGFENLAVQRLAGSPKPAPPDEVANADVAHGLLGLDDEVPLETETSKVRREEAAATLEGKKGMGWLARNVLLTFGVKKLHPQLAAGLDWIDAHIGKATDHAAGLNLVFNGNDEKVFKDNERVIQTPHLNKATSDILRWLNVKDTAGEQWNWNDPYIRQKFRDWNVSTEDQQKVQKLVTQHGLRHEAWLKILTNALYENNKKATALVLMGQTPDLLPQQAREQAESIHELVKAAQDPQQILAVQQGLQGLSQVIRPDALAAALKHASASNTRTAEALAKVSKRKFFTSEQRYDNWHLVMSGPNNETYRSSFQTREAAQAERLKKEKEGYTLLDAPEKSATDAPRSLPEDWLQTIEELDSQRMQLIDQALPNADPAVRDVILSAVNRANDLRNSKQAFAPLPGTQRNFVEGRENLDMLKNAQEFYARAVNWIRHRDTRADVALEVQHPEIAGSRAMKDYLNQHMENVLTPDNPIVRKINQATYFANMAGNFGNTLLEGFQSLTTGMSALISETGSVKDALRLTAAASKEVLQHVATKEWSDPETKYFMERLAKEGRAAMVLWTDLVDPDSATVKHVTGQAQGKTMQAATAMASALGAPTRAIQHYNDKVGALAGFKLAKEKGLTDEAAWQFALDNKNRGFYTQGKAGRPVGLFSIKTRAVPQLMSSLQTYALGYMTNLVTDFQIGFRDAPKGVTPQQKLGAKKAFIYALAAQATVAGALGLPGMGQALSLIQQTTDFDTKGWLRQNLGKLFDEDQVAGGWMTNLALRGATSGFTPVDVSNRAAASIPFIGVDPYKGFNISNFAGAPGSTLMNFVKMVTSAIKGDGSGFSQGLPAVLRGPAELLHGGGNITDSRGALVTSLSPYEQAMTAMGITPSRVQTQRDVAQTVKNLNDKAQHQKGALYDEVAQLARAGRTQEATQKLLDAKKADPNLDLTSAVRSVSDRAEKQNFSYDWRRDLDPSVQLAGLGSREPANNSARLQYRNQIQSQFGVRPTVSPMSMYSAELQDSLMDSDPTLSSSQARRRSQETLRAPRRNTLPLQMAFQ